MAARASDDGWGRRIGRVGRWLVIGVAAVVLLGLAWAGGRVLFYSQSDDASHVEAKRAYLERVADVASGRTETPPNVVLILFDDLGYGDLGAYGGRAIRTPNLDRLAAEGVLFRHAYAPSPYCSASRAGLLTGRHAVRSGLHHVLQAPGTWQDALLRLGGRNRRLPAEEITLSEVLAAAGYVNGMYGKWHLGDTSPSLPNDRGFSRFWGLLFSNDQGEPVIWEDREVAESHPIDQSTLTRRYTDRAVDFLERHADRPFFLYLPHTFPHIPLHASAVHQGRSQGGPYGDVVEELDASVGRVVSTLERLAIADRTLVLVSSDNGPWFQGSAGALRGRKFDVFEGGTRVPLIAWWPGSMAGERTIETPVSALDVFPTVLRLAGLPLPEDRVIDGVSLTGLLLQQEPAPERPIVFHQLGVARAVRAGHFKLHDRHAVRFGNPMNWLWSPNRPRGPWLFDLAHDPGESYDVSESHPSLVKRLSAVLADWQRSLDENPRGWQ